jgi:hypothetical protein
MSGVLLLLLNKFLIPAMLMDSRKFENGRFAGFVYDERRVFDFLSYVSESGKPDLGLVRKNDLGGGATSDEEADVRE